jgi:Flp pilus assembly protein TadG
MSKVPNKPNVTKGRNAMMRNDRTERGSAALEILMSLPVLVVVAFGVIEFGRAFQIRESLVSAASEAARVASESSCPRATSAEVKAVANLTLQSAGLDPASADIQLTNPGGEPGTDATVDLSYDVGFPVLSKFLNLAWLGDDGTFTMTVRVNSENE